MSQFTDTKVIQLREKFSVGMGAGDNYINGAYESSFNELTLDEGDMCMMKSCYLDTAESSAGKIVIKPNETNFSLSFYHYIMNWTSDFKEYNGGGTSTTQQPDGKDYYLCNTKQITGGETHKLESITLTEMRSYGVGSWGDAGVIFQYVASTETDPTKLSFFTLNVPNIKHDPSDKITFNAQSVDKNGNNLGLGFLFNSNYRFEISRTKNDIGNLESVAHSIDCSNIAHTSVVENDGSTRVPHQFHFDFIIPQGAYAPDELARIITDKCSVLRIDGTPLDDYPMRSPFLTTNRQFATEFSQDSNNTFYVAEDGADFYRYLDPNSNDFLSGTSEFGLKYDEGQDKYQFETLNNPFYVNGAPSVSAKQIGSSASNPFFLINKNCGIAFTQMSPPNVWFKKMGFDPSICISFTSHTKSFGSITNQILPIIKGALAGTSTTGTYKGLDTAVYKTGGIPTGGVANLHGERAYTSAMLESTPTATNNQIIIYADTQTQQLKYDYAYYMIEIDLGFNQELLSNKYNNNKIQSVIGRFYSKDSFTNAYNEGSIPYIHRGKSIKISGAKVRILNDDGIPADDIGDNNTVFLEIVKNVNAPSTNLLTIPLEDFKELEEEVNKK
tara:strand:+ start:3312 stop:5150 length:1839 start_codon:yes stop_codon:yes gene_type:complete